MLSADQLPDEVQGMLKPFIIAKERLVKVGVGGALIQFHPTYHELLEAQLHSLAPLNIEWELVPADEGSVKGAALIAAVAEKLKL
uniref:Phosphotransferase n=1 Tax=Globodera pallida TaxID=36090 RepID=A0A183CLG3_GLOPA